MTDPRQRFTGRSADYVRFRTGYAPALVDVLERRCGLSRDSVVADLGSGTGTLTAMLLGHGASVYAVEPNREMREAAERELGGRTGFVSVDGAAEATTLADASVDLVTAGRALQWFDGPAALREMARILRPDSWAAAVWNHRPPGGTPFVDDYNRVLHDYTEDYPASAARRENAIALLEGRGFCCEKIPMPRHFDLEELKGLLRSLSISPDEANPRFQPMMRELETIFARHEHDGVVTIEYTTAVYYGRP